MPRKDKYLDALDARYRYARTLERIDRDLADEQQRFQAAQSYAAQVRSEFNQLDTALSQVQDQSGIAGQLIGMVDLEDIAAQRAISTASSARAAGQQTPTWARAILDPALPGQVGIQLSTIASGDKGGQRMTLAQVDAVAADARALGASEAMVATWRSRLPAGDRPAVPSGAPSVSPQRTQNLEATRRAMEILEFGGPAGITGGFEGEAEANRRAAAALPAGSLFATEDDAYRAYLSLLDDGRVTAEELAVQYPDATEEEVAQGLRVAQATYGRAKASKAYRNDERKFFSQRYLDQARKVAELETRAAELEPQFTDPAQERLRRQLIERGLDPDDPYLEFKGTPMYGYARTADRLLDEVAGQELQAATRDQTAVKRLLDQYEASSVEWTVVDLERQLGKVLKGRELESAIAFGLALDRQRSEGVEAPTQATLQAEQVARVEKADARLAALETREAKRLNSARVEKDRVAQMVDEAATAAASTEARAEEGRKAYQRARASGLTPDQSRQVMRSMFAEPEDAPADLLSGGGVTIDEVVEVAPAPAPVAPPPPAATPAPAPAPARLQPLGPAMTQAQAVEVFAPAPSTPAPTPAPTPASTSVRNVTEMTDQELETLIAGGRP